jgi:hypothetical protein
MHIQIADIQAGYGRDTANYNYDRAYIHHGRMSINGRFWPPNTVFDYVSRTNARQRLAVGRLRDFVVVDYTHKEILRKRGRVRANTLQGRLVFVRADQYNPIPPRSSGYWVTPRRPQYKLAVQAVSTHDLCGYLHIARERDNRRGFVMLVRVAEASVV